MKAEDLAELPTSDRALLQTPEAKRVFLRLRTRGWIVPLLECSNPVYKRLGAKLLIQEIVCAVSPEKAAEYLKIGKKAGRPFGWKSTNGRGTCPYCARSIAIKNDGALRGHDAVRAGGDPCSGSGCRPNGSAAIGPEGKGDAAVTLREIRTDRLKAAQAAIVTEYGETFAALADDRVSPAPFFPLPWVEVDDEPDTERDANPRWSEDLLRAEEREKREAAAADRAERKAAREAVRTERLEKAARLGIFKRR